MVEGLFHKLSGRFSEANILYMKFLLFLNSVCRQNRFGCLSGPPGFTGWISFAP